MWYRNDTNEDYKNRINSSFRFLFNFLICESAGVSQQLVKKFLVNKLGNRITHEKILEKLLIYGALNVLIWLSVLLFIYFTRRWTVNAWRAWDAILSCSWPLFWLLTLESSFAKNFTTISLGNFCRQLCHRLVIYRREIRVATICSIPGNSLWRTEVALEVILCGSVWIYSYRLWRVPNWW